MKTHRNPSVMEHKFSEVPKAEIPRSTFDRSNAHKTCFDAGWLIPVWVDEALPGDTFKLNATAFSRMSTPIFPVMDNLYQDIHFFAVPVRLLWDNWARMNGEQDNPADSTSYLVPVVTPPAAGFTIGSMADYFGIPTGIANGPTPISALFFRAYNKVYFDWYKDQNLVNSPPIRKGDGPDAATDYVLQRRAKRPDYFTTCLPWPQKGPGVMVPLGTSATIKTQATNLVTGVQQPMKMLLVTGSTPANNTMTFGSSDGSVGQTSTAGAINSGAYPSNLYADLSTATAATINSLRQAFQIQKIYERDARGGTRLIEIIKAHFGVTSPDARMQRSEFLGAASATINITPVPQMSNTPAVGTPQGNLAGFGTGLANGGFTMSFTEHCILIGISSVRADLTYQRGLERQFQRRTRFDFYWPALAHIGEQAVLNNEIYAQGTGADTNVFGYQERYGEYRYKNSLITNKFRSVDPGTLDAWHLSQDFASLPVLDKTFIEENPPMSRVLAVSTEPHFISDMYFKTHCTRPMPVYGVPGLIDHF